MDQTTGAQRPGLPFLSRTNRLRAEGGGLARRPERCNPGYRPGGERSGAAAKLCPLTTEARIILERPQGPRPMRAQRASVRISFWGDPRPGFPDLDRTNDGGAVRPRSCSLPSFGQRPVMHKVGGPPPSLCISVLTNQVREERKNRCIRMGGSDLRSWSVTTGSTRAHYRRLRRLDASC